MSSTTPHPSLSATTIVPTEPRAYTPPPQSPPPTQPPQSGPQYNRSYTICHVVRHQPPHHRPKQTPQHKDTTSLPQQQINPSFSTSRLSYRCTVQFPACILTNFYLQPFFRVFQTPSSFVLMSERKRHLINVHIYPHLSLYTPAAIAQVHGPHGGWSRFRWSD